MNRHGMAIIVFGLVICVCSVLGGLAQEKQTTENPQTLPRSTNPANRVIYPAEGQSTDQQMKDQLECYTGPRSRRGGIPLRRTTNFRVDPDKKKRTCGCLPESKKDAPGA
jgi:hypothetical protein